MVSVVARFLDESFEMLNGFPAALEYPVSRLGFPGPQQQILVGTSWDTAFHLLTSAI
jgi:hypothetical protein